MNSGFKFRAGIQRFVRHQHQLRRWSTAFFSVFAFFILALSSSGAQASENDTLNIRFDPLGVVIGALGLSVDMNIGDYWSIGPELEYLHFKLNSSDQYNSKFDVKLTSIGIRFNWFLNGTFNSGFYVGPSLKYVSDSLNTADNNGSASGRGSDFIFAGLVGYGWFWQTFNLMMGAGGRLALGDNQVTIRDSSGRETRESPSLSGVALEFTTGFKF